MHDFNVRMISKHRRDKSDWKTVGAHMWFQEVSIAFGKTQSEGAHTLKLDRIVKSISISDHKTHKTLGPSRKLTFLDKNANVINSFTLFTSAYPEDFKGRTVKFE